MVYRAHLIGRYGFILFDRSLGCFYFNHFNMPEILPVDVYVLEPLSIFYKFHDIRWSGRHHMNVVTLRSKMTKYVLVRWYYATVWVAETQLAGSCDGFLLVPVYSPSQTAETIDRGLYWNGYSGSWENGWSVSTLGRDSPVLFGCKKEVIFIVIAPREFELLYPERCA